MRPSPASPWPLASTLELHCRGGARLSPCSTRQSGAPFNPQQLGCSEDGCFGLLRSKPLACVGAFFIWDPARGALPLLNSACELRLYQRRPLEARDLAEEQIRLHDLPRAHVNLSLSLRCLNDLEGALFHQQRALQQWLSSHILDDAACGAVLDVVVWRVFQQRFNST